jgi:LCP family protein required for cell wall assembly
LQQPTNQQPPANSGATKANTRPNAKAQSSRPGPTYRARPATPAPRYVVAPRDTLADRTTIRMQTEVRRQRIRLAMFMALGFLVAGGIATYAFVISPIREAIVDVSHMVNTPNPIRIPIANVNNSGGPTSTPETMVFPDWGKDPVNILLLGLDYRPQEESTRSDTMIVVHIDPVEKTASMISIPRDLWVNIPNHGEGRINTSYQVGESDEEVKASGGGPLMAMSTVQGNFDIPIHYYAQVNFDGFEKVVDAMGGITVDVPKPLVDNDYPLANYGTTRIYIPAGLQHMDGRTALQYARSRHADSDIGRNSRQQQVLLALRQKGLNMNILSHFNELVSNLSDAIQTDIPIDKIGSLAQLANEIDRNSIQTLSVGEGCVYETILDSGAQVLMPDWSCINPKVKQLFANQGLVKEAARIMVQNGTTTNGIGSRLRETLEKDDTFAIHDVTPAPDQGEHPVTTITDYSGGTKPHTISALATSLGIDPSDVKTGRPADAPISPTDDKPIDILVIAGDDRVR